MAQTRITYDLLAELRKLARQEKDLPPALRQTLFDAFAGLSPANVQAVLLQLSSDLEVKIWLVDICTKLKPELQRELRRLLDTSFAADADSRAAVPASGRRSRADRFEVSLAPDLTQVLHSLKSTRGPCPSAEELIEYEDLAAAARRRHPIHSHVRICSTCQLLLEETSPPARWRDRIRGLFLPVRPFNESADEFDRWKVRNNRDSDGPALGAYFGSRLQVSRVAAVLLAFVGLGALLWNLRLRDDMTTVIRARQELQRQYDDMRGERQNAQQQVDGLQRQLSENQKQMDTVNRLLQEERARRTPPAGPGESLSGIASIILVPGLVRGRPPNTLSIANSIVTASLELPVRADATLVSYKAELTAPDGRILTSIDTLRPRVKDGQTGIVWMVQADLLVAGDYVVNVWGRDRAGQLESGGTVYQLRIIKS